MVAEVPELRGVGAGVDDGFEFVDADGAAHGTDVCCVLEVRGVLVEAEMGHGASVFLPFLWLLQAWVVFMGFVDGLVEEGNAAIVGAVLAFFAFLKAGCAVAAWQAAHRLPCRGAGASLCAVGTDEAVDEVFLSGVAADTCAVEPVVAAAVTADHPGVVVGLAADTVDFVGVFDIVAVGLLGLI